MALERVNKPVRRPAPIRCPQCGRLARWRNGRWVCAADHEWKQSGG